MKKEAKAGKSLKTHKEVALEITPITFLPLYFPPTKTKWESSTMKKMKLPLGTFNLSDRYDFNFVIHATSEIIFEKFLKCSGWD
jgi:hypothetical protein